MSQAKIVVLDGEYANPGDLSWDGLNEFGEVEVYQKTPQKSLIKRAKDASIIITNKVEIREKDFDQLPNLKLIIISATGMNNVDLGIAKSRGIPVKNVSSYSTNSVAQHTWALILELTNRVAMHDMDVKKGNWNKDKGFSYMLTSIPELSGRKLGIYGLGEIGRKVADIGTSFGMNILVCSNHARQEDYPDFQLVNLDELFLQSDIISLHAPLRDDNYHVVDKNLLHKMKHSAMLINTARGPLVDENDLFDVLNNQKIRGAALDVLNTEPAGENHRLFDLDNCIITPHMAWMTKVSRSTLIQGVVRHIADYVNL